MSKRRSNGTKWRRHPTTLGHHSHDAGRTYSCNGHAASTGAINCQVNLRQEMVVAFQVCSGVSLKARSHSLGTAGEPVWQVPGVRGERKRANLQMNRVLRQQYHRKTICYKDNTIYPSTRNGSGIRAARLPSWQKSKCSLRWDLSCVRYHRLCRKQTQSTNNTMWNGF